MKARKKSREPFGNGLRQRNRGVEMTINKGVAAFRRSRREKMTWNDSVNFSTCRPFDAFVEASCIQSLKLISLPFDFFHFVFHNAITCHLKTKSIQSATLIL